MKSHALEALARELDISQNTAAYHNAKLLLKIYSCAVWNTRDAVDELVYAYSEAYEIGDIAALECLVSMYESNCVKQLESKLRCVAQNKIIMDSVEKSMMRVQSYPMQGALYFTILSKNYFTGYPYTETEIVESLNISRSTYYRRRKEAITVFGMSMWGYILPKVLFQFKKTGDAFLGQK